MTFLDVVLIALIQGLAEVLPLGAAGHLALIPRLMASAEGRAAVVVAADVGIVAALMAYFWRDLFIMGRSVIKLAKGRVEPGAHLLFQVLLGSIPALVVTWGFAELGGGGTSRTAAAAALVVFGLFLLAADGMGVTVRRVEHLGWLGAAIIGILQAAAAIPGVSRTGITITAARLMGFERQDAARFSLLLAIPMIAGQACLIVAQLSRQAPLILSTDLMLTTAFAFVVALLAVAGMMAWLHRHTFAPFALWRIVLGLGVLAWGLLP
ncbi:MAG: undecaprenyl-diphosphate phosphatase [Magnetospirillum sp.]|nr:undecaprenyl-diphosphate phosphatase [Magnetospirillum sp.]